MGSDRTAITPIAIIGRPCKDSSIRLERSKSSGEGGEKLDDAIEASNKAVGTAIAGVAPANDRAITLERRKCSMG